MIKILSPKYIFKYFWFGFGLAGVVITANQYFPDLKDNIFSSGLIKGIQTEISSNPQVANFSTKPITLQDLKNLNTETAAEVVGNVVKQEVGKILEETTEEIKEFPAKQIRKIKIGACEELLEEDICSVASELNCSVDN